MKTLTTFLILAVMVLGLMSCKTNSYTLYPKTESTDVDLGYTKVEKRNYTGSASTLEFENEAGSLSNYLQRVPGLYISREGAQETIKIRGLMNSLVSSTDPLFIIDGTRAGNSYEGVKNMLTAGQVARVTVLKDPSDTAIYGVAGANGVIIIRTKKK